MAPGTLRSDSALSPDAPLLVVIGPSGSGKSTLIREFSRRGVLAVTPTWTDRPLRDGEASSAPEHRFVSPDAFDSAEREGLFLATATLFGLTYRYGVPPVETPPPGRIPALILRAPLVERLSAFFRNPVIYGLESAEPRSSRHIGTVGSRFSGRDDEMALGRTCAVRVFVNDGTREELFDAFSAALAKDFPRAGDPPW